MKKLFDISEVAEMIKNKERLVLAASEELLKELPGGNWIAGTIPYFMGENGGLYSKTKIFVDRIPEFVTNISIKFYNEEELSSVALDEFENGYSMIIIPAFSPAHISFAENAGKYKNIFLRPLVGWITGIGLDELGKVTPKVFNGITGESTDQKALVMHLELPPDKIPVLDIVNLFRQGDGDSIQFDTEGFSVSDCYINDQKRNFSDYLQENKIDIKLPLVADYCDAMINTSFQSVDPVKKTVTFYAPVFKGVEYKIASPVEDYIHDFTKLVSGLGISPVFTCNCILNYLYSNLEGKKTADLTGPITFGEIAYQLLNQTLVYLSIQEE